MSKCRQVILSDREARDLRDHVIAARTTESAFLRSLFRREMGYPAEVRECVHCHERLDASADVRRRYCSRQCVLKAKYARRGAGRQLDLLSEAS